MGAGQAVDGPHSDVRHAAGHTGGQALDAHGPAVEQRRGWDVDRAGPGGGPAPSTPGLAWPGDRPARQ
ncbi:hypothetical protein [Plantactinospora sp. GCM10030261]|uniref:hypothetical protein n=1 Tax=Plantactinospora sp. GCM10030261 TaxID=3273420 RepID=UPI003615F946